MENAVYFFIDAPWWIATVALVLGAAFAFALLRPVRFPMVVACGLVGLAGGFGVLIGAVIDDRMGLEAEELIWASLIQGPILGYLGGLAVLVRSQWRTFRNLVITQLPADHLTGKATTDAAQSTPNRQSGTPDYSIGECLTAVGLIWWTAGSVLNWVCGGAMGALFGSCGFSASSIAFHEFNDSLTPGLFHTASYKLTLRTPAAIVGGEVVSAVALLIWCSLGPWQDGFLGATLRFRARLGWDRRRCAAARFNLVPLAAIPIGLVCLFFGVYMGVSIRGSNLTPGEQLLKSVLLTSGLGFLGLSCLATNLALLRNERWPGLTALGLCVNAFPILYLVVGLPFEVTAVVVGCLSGSCFIWLVVRWMNCRADHSRVL